MDPHVKDSIDSSGHLSFGAVEDIVNKLTEDGTLFRVDRLGLARHFAAAFMGKEAFRASIPDIRALIVELTGLAPHKVPEEEYDFLQWFLQDILYLERPPSRALEELYAHASEDLASIQRNIDKCDAEIVNIERRTPKTGDNEQDAKFFGYFKDLNVEARNEIVSVLASSIREKALAAAQARSRYSLNFFDAPWSFRWFTDRFDPGSFSDLRHRFLHLPLDRWHEVDALYKNDPGAFKQLLHEYFEEHRPVQHVRDACSSDHHLAARRDILLPAIEAFERREYALFCSAIAVQIEGIFEDCCIELGEGPNSLHSATLRPKLDVLVRRRGRFGSYPYYAFRFAKLRNRIAHGRILEPEQIVETAHFLLLDLVNVIAFHSQLESPGRLMISLLKSDNSGSATLFRLKFASLLADGAERPPDFYQLGLKYDTMRAELQQEGAALWQYAKALSKAALDDCFTNSLRRVAIAMVRLKLSTDAAREFLRECTPTVYEDAYEQDAFWNGMDRAAESLQRQTT